MIFIQPIILAGEFITHAILLVLIGALAVESFISRRYGSSSQKTKSISLLLAIVSLGAAMIWFEFFVGRGAIWPNLIIYAPGIILIFYLVFLFERSSRAVPPKIYSYSFLGAVAAILVFTVVFVFTQHQLVVLGSTVSQVVGVISLFLYIHSFLILKEDDNKSGNKNMLP